ncbi:MAG: hypothetical protein AAGK78_15620 [Planctomycetota bacterium]
MQRNPRFAEVYRAHLEIGKWLGMRTHGVFVDVGNWGKHGQWGHKQQQIQPVGYRMGQAVKWATLLDFKAEHDAINELGVGASPVGVAPALEQQGEPIRFEVSTPVEQSWSATAGDGKTTLTIIASGLPRGMRAAVSGLTVEVTGQAGPRTLPGEYRMLVRALDEDGDVDYAIYTFKLGGS